MNKKIIRLAAMFISLPVFSSCALAKESMSISVNLMGGKKNEKSPLIKITFQNSSSQDYWLYKYNFCESGVLFQNIFTVKNVNFSSKDAVYGGPVDFFNPNVARDEEFINIKAGESATCVVNLYHYYYFPESGEYSVLYKVSNPGYRNQNRLDLISNNQTILKIDASDLKQ